MCTVCTCSDIHMDEGGKNVTTGKKTEFLAMEVSWTIRL